VHDGSKFAFASLVLKNGIVANRWLLDNFHLVTVTNVEAQDGTDCACQPKAQCDACQWVLASSILTQLECRNKVPSKSPEPYHKVNVADALNQSLDPVPSANHVICNLEIALRWDNDGDTGVSSSNVVVDCLPGKAASDDHIPNRRQHWHHASHVS
jgi:hypothetical protein